MSKAPAPLPRELGAHFTLADAREAGVSRERLRRKDIASPFRGIFQSGPRDAPSSRDAQHSAPAWKALHLDRAKAFMSAMRNKPWFFCGVTAALFWNMPIPRPSTDAIEIAVHVPAYPPTRRGVRSSRLIPALSALDTINGALLTSPAATWAQLGSRLSLRDLIACGDAVVHRARIPGTNRLEHPPLTTIECLRDEIAKGKRRGNAKLRDAIEHVRTESASPPETHTRTLLVSAGLPEPDLDVDVFDANGQFIGCSEMAYREARVAIEYESEHHRVDRNQWNRDIRKYHDYATAGWTVIRVTASMLYRNPEQLIGLVRSALNQGRRNVRR